MKPTSTIRNSHQDSEDTLWSTSDVAKFLRCSERQVFSLRQRGLPAIQVGGLIRFNPARVRQWLGEADEVGQDDLRGQQLADIASTGDEDNAEISRDELERQSFDHRNVHLPFQGKLSWSLLSRVPAGAYVISLTCNPDGSSVFTGQTGDPSERHRMWTTIREAGADQRNCVITMDDRVAEAMARPFPADPEERNRDWDLRSALLSGQSDLSSPSP